MKRFFLGLSATLSIVLLCALFTTSSVSAYSPYDNAYRTTDDPTYKGYYCNEPRSAVNWPAILLSEDSYYSNQSNSAQVITETRDQVADWLLTTAQQDGGISFSIGPNGIARIILAPDGGTIKFDNFGSPMYPNPTAYIDSPGDVMIISLGFSSTGVNPTPDCEQAIRADAGLSVGIQTGSAPGRMNLAISNPFDIVNYFAEGFSIEYPDDYQGAPIVTTEPVPPVTSLAYPDIFIASILDYKMTVHDRNFFTFDEPVRTLCVGGLTPIVKYRYFYDDFTSDDFYTSPTTPIEVEFPRVNEQRTYIVHFQYQCPEGEGEPVFSEFTIVDNIRITEGGLGASTLMDGCMTEEFPFVNFNECVEGIKQVITLLSFDTIRFDNSVWTHSPGCYQLKVLDDWISRPNQTVCTYFPEHVRNIVTPFVTFLFGLLTMKFITSRGGHGFN